MRVRRASPHDPSSSLLQLRRQARRCRVEGPQNYPVRPFGEGRARSSVRVSGAPVRPPSQHILETRLRIGGFGPVRVPIVLPLQSISVSAVSYVINDPRVSRKTSEAILALPQNGLFPILIPINYLGRLCNVGWPCGKGTGNLRFLSLCLWLGGLLLSSGYHRGQANYKEA